MRLLVLGGTRFMGSWLSELALARGHDLTVLHRGRSQATDLDDATHVIADRGDGHELLAAGEPWDAVIDTSGYMPSVVGDAARVLREHCEHYVFVSSVSVYADLSQRGLDEGAGLAQLPEELVEQVTTDLKLPVPMEHYGALKVLCERAVREQFAGGRSTIVRPGLIVGPRDYTDRFNYWVRRAGEGGELLAPAPSTARAQVIDARDLAAFVLGCAERQVGGVFNVGGPVFEFGQLVEAALQMTGGADAGGSATWVDAGFLQDAGVEPWSELPLWLPDGSGYEAMNDFNASAAMAAGLRTRELHETVADTWEWMQRTPGAAAPPEALSRERETDLLVAWHAREQ